jgi:hypothetical protein
MAQLMDAQHGQRYIEGHGGKALWKRRVECLVCAIAHVFETHGISPSRALAGARWCVEQSLRRAQQLMRVFGYSYLDMKWRLA